MANGRPAGPVVPYLARLFEAGCVSGLDEGQLLDRFLGQRDAAAFEALVARHGPTVLGVCRRMLRDPHDVEDAFQATFMVLVRKAGSLRDRRLLGNWLYGVALRVSKRARAVAARRHAKERPDVETLAGCAAPEETSRSWLLEEIDRLPREYRAAILLCYFEGLSHEEAAERLGWPLGTVKGRLARARDRLRVRLGREGLTLSTAAFAERLARDAEAAPLPPALVETTIEAAGRLAAGQAATAGVVSAAAAALMEGVVRTMFLAKLKLALSAVAVAALVTAGAVLTSQRSSAEGDDTKSRRVPADPPTESAERLPPTESAERLIRTTQERLRDANEEAFKTLLDACRDGRTTDLDRIHRWSEHLLEAQLALSEREGDRATAYADQARRMKRLHELTQRLSGEDQPLKADTARAYALEAERALARAGSKPAVVAAPGGVPALPGAMPPGGTGPRQFAAAGKREAMYGRPPQQVVPPLPKQSGPMSMMSQMGYARPAHYDRLAIARMGRHLEEVDKDPRSRAIVKKLNEPVSMSFAQPTPLEDILKYIKSATAGPNDTGFSIYVDPQGLKEAEQTLSSPVTLDLEGVSLRTSLRLLLKQVGLAYCVKDGVLMISSPKGIYQELEEATAYEEDE